MTKKNVLPQDIDLKRTAPESDLTFQIKTLAVFYWGTSAQFIAEGLIPKGFLWPIGTKCEFTRGRLTTCVADHGSDRWFAMVSLTSLDERADLVGIQLDEYYRNKAALKDESIKPSMVDRRFQAFLSRAIGAGFDESMGSRRY